MEKCSFFINWRLITLITLITLFTLFTLITLISLQLIKKRKKKKWGNFLKTVCSLKYQKRDFGMLFFKVPKCSEVGIIQPCFKMKHN